MPAAYQRSTESASGEFHFKAFTIVQQQTTWKVSTDSVLLGAWTRLENEVYRILDIGAGTGVLSLMLAQRCAHARIEAVEIDPLATHEMLENFERSRWADRLSVHRMDIRKFMDVCRCQYDLVVCNPPYFPPHVPVREQRKFRARMGEGFALLDVPGICKRLLGSSGSWAVVMPAPSAPALIRIANSCGFYAMRRLNVSHHSGDAPSLVLVQFSNKLISPRIEHLQLCDETGWTTAYRQLCSEYRDIG